MVSGVPRVKIKKNKESPSSSTRSRTPSRPKSANLGDGHGRGAAHFVRQRWACFWVSGTQRDQISMSIHFRCLCSMKLSRASLFRDQTRLKIIDYMFTIYFASIKQAVNGQDKFPAPSRQIKTTLLSGCLYHLCTVRSGSSTEAVLEAERSLWAWVELRATV